MKLKLKYFLISTTCLLTILVSGNNLWAACTQDSQCLPAQGTSCVKPKCDLTHPSADPEGCVYLYDATAGGDCAKCQETGSICGNGRCELPDENRTTCPADCLTPSASQQGPNNSVNICNYVNNHPKGGDDCNDYDVCTNNSCLPPTQGTIQSTCSYPNTISCGGNVIDLCCPAGCQGTDPADADKYDIDCCIEKADNGNGNNNNGDDQTGTDTVNPQGTGGGTTNTGNLTGSGCSLRRR